MRAWLWGTVLAGCAGESTFEAVPGGVQPPGQPPIVLTVSDAYPGSRTTWTATGAYPGERVYFFASSALGSNACPSQLGGQCFDIRGPVSWLGADITDAKGEASVTLTVPPTLPVGFQGAFQAVVARGASGVDSSLSAPVVGVLGIPPCGDGIVDVGEACDDGNDVDEDACLTTCAFNVCGDGIFDATEEACDDGNTVGGDFCSGDCAQITDIGFVMREQPVLGTLAPKGGAPAPDGGSVVVGQWNAGGLQDNDLFVARYDAVGQRMWAKGYGTQGDETGAAVVAYEDGWIVASSNPRLHVLRLNGDGSIRWQQRIEGPPTMTPAAMTLDPTDGRVLIVGSGRPGPQGTGDTDIFVVRMTVDGVLWDSVFMGTNGYDTGNKVLPLDDGSVIVGAYTDSRIGGGFREGWVIKLDANLDVVWNRLLPAYRRGNVHDLHDYDGGILVAGSADKFQRSQLGFLLHLSTAGNTLDYKPFDETLYLNDLVEDAQGDLFAGGTFSRTGQFTIDSQAGFGALDGALAFTDVADWTRANFAATFHRSIPRDTGGWLHIGADSEQILMVQTVVGDLQGSCDTDPPVIPPVSTDAAPTLASWGITYAPAPVSAIVASSWTDTDALMVNLSTCAQ